MEVRTQEEHTCCGACQGAIQGVVQSQQGASHSQCDEQKKGAKGRFFGYGGNASWWIGRIEAHLL